MDHIYSSRINYSKIKLNNKLLILGCEGQAKVATDIAEAIGFQDISYEDPYRDADTFLDRKVFKSVKENYSQYFIVAIGNNFLRERVSNQFLVDNKKAQNINLIHPSSIISNRFSMGNGNIIMPLCVINSSTKIGDGVIINTKSSVDHDNHLMSFSSLAPGVTTGGNVSIGKRTAISIGTTIKHGVRIGSDVVVGASSLVMNDINNNLVSYGTPAKFIRKRSKEDDYL